jgi:dTDP-L-rhamnose 4-epimerase
MNKLADAQRTVLVTGGAGFIGCAISTELADRFGSIIAVDNLHPQVHATGERPAALDSRVELIVADVTEPETWATVFATHSPDIVIHLAAETGTGQSLDESTRHASVNVVGTTQLLDGLQRLDRLPSRVVLTSSRAVYGEGAWIDSAGAKTYPGQRSQAMLEAGIWDFAGMEPVAMHALRVEPRPVSVYGATKLAQEHVLTSWALAKGVDVVVLRLQNVYGPGQSLTNPYTGIMSLFCRMAKAGESIPLFEDGDVRRDFVFIDDVARAVIAAATAAVSPGRPVDIGCGEMQTIGTAANLFADFHNAPEPSVTGQFRHGDVRHAWADIADARELLGWEPKIYLNEGVERLAQWIDAQAPAAVL